MSYPTGQFLMATIAEDESLPTGLPIAGSGTRATGPQCRAYSESSGIRTPLHSSWVGPFLFQKAGPSRLQAFFVWLLAYAFVSPVNTTTSKKSITRYQSKVGKNGGKPVRDIVLDHKSLRRTLF